MELSGLRSLKIQIAQSRHDLHTFGLKVGIIHILGSLQSGWG